MFKTFKPQSHKVKCLVYGASGVGKTRFAATAPKPVFLSAEAGLLSTIGVNTDDIAYTEIKTLENLKKAYAALEEGKHEFETVVIDSITEINEIIKEGIEKENGRSMQLNDWGTLAKEIRGILRNFRNLDMHVIFIAQEQSEKDDQTIHKIVPSLNGKAATEIAYYMDTVGYMNITGQGQHTITTKPNPRYLSKSRYEFTDEPDFQLWVSQLGKLEIQEPLAKGVVTDILARWSTLMTLQEKDTKHHDGIRRKTLEKLYGTTTTNDLSIEQAKDFIERLDVKIATERANQKDVGKGGDDDVQAVDLDDNEKKEEPKAVEPPERPSKTKKGKKSAKTKKSQDSAAEVAKKEVDDDITAEDLAHAFGGEVEDEEK